MQQYRLANPWIGLKIMVWPAIQWIGWLINRLVIHYTGSEVGSKNKSNPLIGWPIIDCLANTNFVPIHIFWMQQYWLANPWIGLENYGLAVQ